MLDIYWCILYLIFTFLIFIHWLNGPGIYSGGGMKRSNQLSNQSYGSI